MYFISNGVYIYCYQHKHHSRLFNNCLNICQNGSNSGGLFALLMSGAPYFQLSNGASAVQISGVAAELFMFLDCMALWTCKGDISDFKACNYYSFFLPTAIYTGNTVLAHLDHLPCHSFTMQYVPPLLFVIVWQLFEQCSNISIYLRRIVRFVSFGCSLSPAFQRCLCCPNWWTGC